jgi:hypothetical protein
LDLPAPEGDSKNHIVIIVDGLMMLHILAGVSTSSDDRIYNHDHQLRPNRHIVSPTDIHRMIKSGIIIRATALLPSTFMKTFHHCVIGLPFSLHLTSIKLSHWHVP